MHAAQLERHQIGIHLAAIALGLAAGTAQPGLHAPFEAPIRAALAALLSAAVVIVLQSLIEPPAMSFHVWWVPHRLFRR